MSTTTSSHALLELLHTERQYTSDIHTLLNVYLNHLARYTPLDIPHVHCRLITRNAHQLLAHHTRFLIALENIFASLPLGGGKLLGGAEEEGQLSGAPPALLGPLSASIANLFLSSSENGSWSVYEEFCAGQSNALSLVRSYASSKPAQWSAFEKFCAEILAHQHSAKPGVRRKLTFQDYLMAPVQRICRYPLLLGAAFPRKEVERGSVQERSIEAMKEVAASVDRAKGEELMRTVLRRLGLVRGMSAVNLAGVGSGGGATGPDGVQLVLTGAVQARVPTSNGWEYLAAFLTQSKGPHMHSSTRPTSPTRNRSAQGQVVLLLARVERVRSSEEDLRDSLYQSMQSSTDETDTSQSRYSKDLDLSLACAGSRWKYEVVWGIPLSSSSSVSSPAFAAGSHSTAGVPGSADGSIPGGVFQVEFCDDPPNGLRFVPRSAPSRRTTGRGRRAADNTNSINVEKKESQKRRRGAKLHRRSKSASASVSGGVVDERNTPGRLSRSSSTSALSTKSPKTLPKEADTDIAGLPPSPLSLSNPPSPPILLCESPTEPAFNFPSSQDQANSTNGSPKKLKKSRKIDPLPTPLHSTAGFTLVSGCRGRPAVPSLAPIFDSSSNNLSSGPSAQQRETRNSMDLQTGATVTSAAVPGEAEKSDSESHTRGRKLKKKGFILPSPTSATFGFASGGSANGNGTGASFTVVSGSRGQLSEHSHHRAGGELERSATTKSRFRSKIFTIGPSFAEDTDEHTFGEDVDGGMTMTIIRTACAGERDVWIEKMRECGVGVVRSSPASTPAISFSADLPIKTRSTAAGIKGQGLARAKSTSAVDASFRIPELPPLPPLPSLVEGVPRASTDPLPTAQTFAVEPRWSKGKGKAMSDVGHGGSEDGPIPRSRSSFGAWLPPGISKETSLLRTGSTSAFEISQGSGSRRLSHYGPPSYRSSLLFLGGAPGAGGLTLRDTGDVDEGIADIASDALIRKRVKARIEGEVMFPTRPALPPIQPSQKDQKDTGSGSSTRETQSQSTTTTSSASVPTPSSTTPPAEDTPNSSAFQQGFDSLRRASTLVRIHSVKSVISFRNSVSDAFSHSLSVSVSSSGVRRSMTIGGYGKGKGRSVPEIDTGSMGARSVPGSVGSSPIMGSFELVEEEDGMPPVGDSSILTNKPLPTTPRARSLRFKSEPVLPPTPLEFDTPPIPDFSPSHYSNSLRQRQAHPRSLLMIPEMLQSRMSVFKTSAHPVTEDGTLGSVSRPQSKLIPPEHRQPVEFIKPTTRSSFTGSFRVKRSSKILSFVGEPVSELGTDKPKLKSRFFGRTNKSENGLNRRVASDPSRVQEHFDFELLPPFELPDVPPPPRKHKTSSSQISVDESLAAAIAVNVRLSRELSDRHPATISGSSEEGVETPPEQSKKDSGLTSSKTYPTTRSQGSEKSHTRGSHTQRASLSSSSRYAKHPGVSSITAIPVITQMARVGG